MRLPPAIQALAENLFAQSVSPERRAPLDALAKTVAAERRETGTANLTFICTHNSRRSHLSQVLAATAAAFQGVEGINCYSGGTEATACNERTVAAFERAGFPVRRITDGDNPVYEITHDTDAPPLRAWSKVYNQDGNPASGYIAVMTCTHADEHCPVVLGAKHRASLPFRDPKEADDTPEEAATYDARLREIGAEMFYLMRMVKEALKS